MNSLFFIHGYDIIAHVYYAKIYQERIVLWKLLGIFAGSFYS